MKSIIKTLRFLAILIIALRLFKINIYDEFLFYLCVTLLMQLCLVYFNDKKVVYSSIYLITLILTLVFAFSENFKINIPEIITNCFTFIFWAISVGIIILEFVSNRRKEKEIGPDVSTPDVINNGYLEDNDNKYGFISEEDSFLLLNKKFSLELDLEKDTNGHYKDIFVRLLCYFESDTPYIRPSININEIAQSIYTNKTYLSKAIHIYTGANFCQFINSYRVKYSIKLFCDDRSLRIMELAELSGVSSLATYLAAFKLNTNLSPSEWCKKYKQNSFTRENLLHKDVVDN